MAILVQSEDFFQNSQNRCQQPRQIISLHKFENYFLLMQGEKQARGTFRIKNPTQIK